MLVHVLGFTRTRTINRARPRQLINFYHWAVGQIAAGPRARRTLTAARNHCTGKLLENRRHGEVVHSLTRGLIAFSTVNLRTLCSRASKRPLAMRCYFENTSNSCNNSVRFSTLMTCFILNQYFWRNSSRIDVWKHWFLSWILCCC